MTIRQTVRRVIVDVLVRDKDGKPVRGLTANDFSVTDDKQPQRILSFDAYDFNQTSISRGLNAPPLPPNLFVNLPVVPERGPLYVILYDLVNTEMEDQMTGRQQILQFINSKPAGTRFALFIATDKLRLIQGFTADKDLLFTTLDPANPKPRVPKVFLYGANYGSHDPYTALDMLMHLGNYLDGIPGRKNLIWMASHFDLALFPREGDPPILQSAVRAEIDALAQAQVAVFPVDLGGVVLNPAGGKTGARPNGGAINAPDSNSLSNPSNNPVLEDIRAANLGSSLVGSYTTADSIAAMTGGRAFYSRNDIAEALREATEEGGTYYTISYAPPKELDNECHRIGVRLAKTESTYQLSYRRSYCHSPLVSRPDDEAPDAATGALPLVFPLQAGDVLQGNMRPGAPMLHDLIFSAHIRTDGPAASATVTQMAQLTAQADYYRTHRRTATNKPKSAVKIQAYSVDYRVIDPQFKAEAARTGGRAMLEFAVAAFDRDGKLLNGVVNDALPESNQGGENKTGLYRVHQALVVPVTAVSIRVGVRDRASDRMGTLEVPLPLRPEPVAQASTPAR